MATSNKKIVYYSTTQKDIAAFPTRIKQRVARLFDMLSADIPLQPNDFKYMPTVGIGAYELRIKLEKQYRVLYCEI